MTRYSCIIYRDGKQEATLLDAESHLVAVFLDNLCGTGARQFSLTIPGMALVKRPLDRKSFEQACRLLKVDLGAFKVMV